MTEKNVVVFSSNLVQVVKKLRKKYRHVEADLNDFVELLEKGSPIGDRLQGTDDYVIYKARVASRDMQRGKSGGFRVIYFLKTENYTVILTMYTKTEQIDISSDEVLDLIHSALEELAEEDNTGEE